MTLGKLRFLAVFSLVAILVAQFGPPGIGAPAGQARAQEGSAESSDPASQRPEVQSLRTKYSKTYREVDGSLTAEITNAPIHFRNGDKWEEIDNSLVPCSDGTCAWRNKAGSFDAAFPANVSDTSLVSIARGNRSFGFGVAGGRAAGAPPVVDENSITYKDVFPSVDLRYEVSSTQVKELIVLNQAPSRPVSVSFPLRLNGLTARQLGSGEIELTDASGDVAFTIPLLWMEDSSDPSTGAPARSEAVTMTLETRGSAQFIRVEPDHEWLSAPERVYPVEVDPAVVIGDDSTEEVYDTYVQAGHASNGSLDYLRIAGSSTGNSAGRALVRFPNLSALPTSVNRIRSAALRLWNHDGNTCGSWRTQVHQILGTWSESVDWNSRPATGAALDNVYNDLSYRGVGTPCPPNFLEFPQQQFKDPGGQCNGVEPQPSTLGQVVRNWKQTPSSNHGLMARFAEEATAVWKHVRSKESNHPPTLVVSYTDPPYQPVLRPVDTSTGSATPTLRAVYNDPDENTESKDHGCLRFEIWRQSDGSQYQSSWVPADFSVVAPGTELPWKPPNALTRGVTYQWRVTPFDEWVTGPSASATYTPPLPPGAPNITGPNPASPSNYLSPSWSFSGQSGGYFQCRLLYEGSEKQGWNTCTSSKSYYLGGAGYYDGTYTIQVKQFDNEGVEGAVGTGNPYVLDRQPPPQPNITSSPPSPGNNTTPTWTFSSGGGDTHSFTCRVLTQTGATAAGPSGCSSSYRPSLTQHGTIYYFEVEAIDRAGNRSGFRRSSGYELDIKADPPAITSAPSSPSENANPSWSFSGEMGATFECRLEGPTTFARNTCTSPHSYSLVAGGTHTFYVRQKDRAGNVSLEASSPYLYDSSDPVPVISSTTHSDSTSWYQNRQPKFSWSVNPTPPSGITGYSYLLDRNDSTLPPETSKGTATSTEFVEPVPEGISWFHVRAKAGTGKWGTQAGHYKIQVDDTDPTDPDAVVSTSHVRHVKFKDNTIDMKWTASEDPKPDGVDAVSGIKEYWWAFRAEGVNGHKGAEADGVCTVRSDCTSSASDPSAQSKGLPDGRYWFHVKAVDNALNVSQDVVVGPFLVSQDGTTVPLAPSLTDLLVAQSDTNGLEQFYPYRSTPLGTATAYTNLDSGNLVVQQSDATIPLVGVNTVIRHTYNSQRDDSARHSTGAGKGWVLSLSDADTSVDGGGGLSGIDVNTPIVSAPVDVVPNVPGQLLELTDADGTTHRFVRENALGSRWTSPPGVDLRVQDHSENGQPQYHLIRPDGVRYVVGEVSFGTVTVLKQWHVVAIRDRNGNELRLKYDTKLFETPADKLFRTRLESVTHNRFSDDPVARFTYHVNGDLDRIETYPNDLGARREIDFTIQDDLLTSVTDNSHTSVADGRRTTSYSYQLHDQDDNPLTPPVDLLASVADARDNTTWFGYARQDGAYRMTQITDRRFKAWKYGYDTDLVTGDRVTTHTSPLEFATTYRISPREKVSDTDPRPTGPNIIEILDPGTNAGRVKASYKWEQNRLVSRTDGAQQETTMQYNDLGQLTRLESPPPNTPGAAHLHADAPQQRIATTFSYKYSSPYPGGGCNDTGQPPGYCFSVADLQREVSAEGMGKQEQVTDFVYASDGSGDLTDIYERANPQLPDDVDRHTAMSYYGSGLLRSVDGPRTAAADITEFGDGSADPYGGYHRSGSPHRIEDAAGKAKTFEYDAYGSVTKITDRQGRLYTMEYDEAGNLLRSTDLWQSLSSSTDDRITSFTYDPNYNKLSATSPRGAETPAIVGDFTTTFAYNENDQRSEVRRPGMLSHSSPRTTTFGYDNDGRRTSIDGPLSGTEDRTTHTYWDNGSLKTTTAPAGSGQLAVDYFYYDSAGRMSRHAFPRADSSGSPPVQDTSYTPRGALSIVRGTSATGQTDRVTKASYDAHGRLIELVGPRQVDGVDQAQRQTYDSFGQIRLLQTRVASDRWLDHKYSYDLAGNVLEVTQPAGGGPADALVTKYSYDVLNRLDEQTVDPFNPGHTVKYSYLPEGQQETRVDFFDPDGDGPLAKGEKRRITHTYNPDDSVQKLIATDKDGKLAQCNYPAGSADATSGYDRDGNLLVTRTLKGGGGCESGDAVAREIYTYNHAGLMSSASQQIDLPGAPEPVERQQSFSYRNDGALGSHTFDNRQTKYANSGAGWMVVATDWRSGSASSEFAYFPAGNHQRISLGGTAATGTFTYNRDGSLRSLAWANSAGTELRAHRSLTYDIGGLWTGETVSILPAAGDTGVDTGGTATFGHDLAGRLTSWKSPYRLNPERPGTDGPVTDYTLDDAGNIKSEVTRVDGVKRREITANYNHGRLASRKIETFGLVALAQDTVTDQSFDYTGLGEEKRRSATTRVVNDPLSQTATAETTTTFDPRGFTSSFDESETASDGTTKNKDLDYIYDASGRVIARTRGNGESRLYFYFAGSRQLMEETTESGASRVRYFVGSSGEPLAEQRVGGATGDAWVWLLRDAKGSVATEMRDNGTVIAQKAYDPYGAPDAGGSSKTQGERESTLGFQAAHTDDVSGRILLGERQYDPTTERFTTPDVYVGSGADLALGTDPLTGNRYIFAAANPVAFYDDGHGPLCGRDGHICKSYTTKKAVNQRNQQAREASAPSVGELVYTGDPALDGAKYIAALHQALVSASGTYQPPPGGLSSANALEQWLGRLLLKLRGYSRGAGKVIGGSAGGAIAVGDYLDLRARGHSRAESAAGSFGALGGGVLAELYIKSTGACAGSGGLGCGPLIVLTGAAAGLGAGFVSREFVGGIVNADMQPPEQFGAFSGPMASTDSMCSSTFSYARPAC